MAGIEPKRVAKDDPRRLAVGVLSVGMSGGYRGFTGQATILGSGVAVTTEGSANLREEALNLWDEGSTAMSHVPLDDVAVEGELGFRILRFAESHAVPSFARAVLPTLGGECRLFWYDYSRNDFFELSGSVAPGHGNRFNLHLKGDAGIALDGAPVFTDQFVVGMVASGPHPDTSTSRPDGTFMVEVLGVAIMAESKATPVVRDLLRRTEGDPSSARSMEGEARPASLAKDATLGLVDDELFGRLSPSARAALARANGMRLARQERQVHIRYLIAGLFPAWKNFFARWNVTEATLNEIVRRQVGVDLPGQYSVHALRGLPPMSKNVHDALVLSTRNADESGSKGIWGSHLLYGALSVDGSKTVKALRELGVSPEDIHAEDEDELGESAFFSHVSQTQRDPSTPSGQAVGQQTGEQADGKSEFPPSRIEREKGGAPTAGNENFLFSQQQREGWQPAEVLRIDDPRLAAVGTLWGDGADAKRLYGHAAVIGQGVAITYEAAALANAKFLEKGGQRLRAQVKPGVVLGELRIGVFGLSSFTTSDPLPRLGPTVEEGAQLNFFVYDQVAGHYYKSSGHVTAKSPRGILLEVKMGLPDFAFGTPIFSDETEKIIGIAVPGPTGGFLIEVVTVEAMVRSESTATRVIRDEWIRQHFNAIKDIVQKEIRPALDSRYIDHSQREALRLEFSDPSLAPISLEDLLDQVVEFANDKGPRLLREGEKTSLTNFSRNLESLLQFVEGSLHPANIDQLPPGFEEAPVQIYLTDLHNELRSLIKLGPGPKPPPASRAAPTPKVDSDLWSEKDELGYEAYARTIAALITHPETVAPLTIGIKAPWGAGKTSLMKRVQHLLDGQAYLTEENRSAARQQPLDPRVTLWGIRQEIKRIARSERRSLGKRKGSDEDLRLPSPSNPEGAAYGLPPRVTVWFNAWKYQTSEQIWAGMAHCIISQVVARMPPLKRELFWLRLHARRVNTNEVRRKVHVVLLRMFVPAAFIILVLCALVIWGAAELQLSMPGQWTVRGVTGLLGLIGMIWKARETLGEKAASTVKELVREPDYEGKMGYLHLVESDIREVLNLVTAAGAKAPAVELRAAGQPGATVPTPVGVPRHDSTQSAPSTGGKEKPAPLVVFVDDLDRCAPNKVAEVVEAINLFLCGDYPNCIFVLGMEPGMVAAALEVANKDVIAKAKEMGLVDGAAPVGWRFMEKIVQMPVMIPPPTKHGRDAYVQSLVGSAGRKNGGPVGVETAAPAATSPAKSAEVPKREPPKEEDVQAFAEQMKGATLAEVEKKSLEIVEAAPAEKRQAAAEAGKRVYAQTFSERDPMIADFVQECAELVEGNPRQIKRYVNVFRFYSTLRYGLKADGLATESELPNDKVLAKFVAMSIQWPHAMDCLRSRHATDEKGQTISRLEHLETKSAEIRGDDAAGDATWKEIVGEKGMGLESWAHARAFRMFLARGESLGKSRGHGLW
jgi:hypothetical protein